MIIVKWAIGGDSKGAGSHRSTCEELESRCAKRTVEGFKEEGALKLEFGSGIGIEQMDSGVLMGGMKNILGRRNNV